MPLLDVAWRASGDPDAAGQMTVRGHAAVFDRLSLDLGGFRERIAPGAFGSVLDRKPDVHLLWDHDTSKPLARTLSSKYLLELREDPAGLHFYARVAPTPTAEELRTLMEGQVVDQASFAFTVERDEWEIDEDEDITRTILEVRDLYDVTITAKGAYPQTDTAVVRSLMQSAMDSGRLPEEARKLIAGKGERQEVAPEAAGRPTASDEDASERVKELQRQTRAEVALARERFYRGKETS